MGNSWNQQPATLSTRHIVEREILNWFLIFFGINNMLLTRVMILSRFYINVVTRTVKVIFCFIVLFKVSCIINLQRTSEAKPFVWWRWRWCARPSLSLLFSPPVPSQNPNSFQTMAALKCHPEVKRYSQKICQDDMMIWWQWYFMTVGATECQSKSKGINQNCCNSCVLSNSAFIRTLFNLSGTMIMYFTISSIWNTAPPPFLAPLESMTFPGGDYGTGGNV